MYKFAKKIASKVPSVTLWLILTTTWTSYDLTDRSLTPKILLLFL